MTPGAATIPTTATGATATLAEAVVCTPASAIDEATRAHAVAAFTDTLGVGVAGSRDELGDRIVRTFRPDDTTRDRRLLLGRAETTEPGDAAFYNAAVIHALDFDDLLHPAHTHPSCHIVPALLAAAQDRHVSGHDLIDAYVIGIETEARLGSALPLTVRGEAWHMLGVVGPIAAACTVARLRKEPVDTVLRAIGIAASSGSGLRANRGTMTKPLHAAFAARNGLAAADLASAGISSCRSALEHRRGLFAAFGDAVRADLEQVDAFGHPWQVGPHGGVAIKPYPSCGATHTAIEAALQLRTRVSAEEIESVRIGTNQFSSERLIFSEPTDGTQGKFSMQYCFAAAIIDGEVTMQSFEPGRVDDPRVRSLMKRITVESDDRLRDHPEFGTIVTVRAQDKSMGDLRVDYASGKPENPMDDRVRRTKFLSCTESLLGDRATTVFAQMDEMTRIDDMWPLLRQFAAPGDDA